MTEELRPARRGRLETSESDARDRAMRHCQALARDLLAGFAVPDFDKAALRRFLTKALRRERGRAKTGSPRYSFNRHLALYQALKSLRGCGSRT